MVIRRLIAPYPSVTEEYLSEPCQEKSENILNHDLLATLDEVTDRLVDGLIKLLIDLMINWIIDWLFDWWSIDCLITWLID